jgi:hypothetical protein
MILNEIFAQLEAEAAKGAALPAPVCPEVEEDLKPFIVRPMTDDEITLLAARDAADLAARKMLAKVLFLESLGLLDAVGPDEIKNDETIKFKAAILADLFFWTIQEATGWQFAALHQRQHEGRLVLVGLKTTEARAYYKKQQEAQQMSELIGEAPGPRLVN